MKEIKYVSWEDGDPRIQIRASEVGLTPRAGESEWLFCARLPAYTQHTITMTVRNAVLKWLGADIPDEPGSRGAAYFRNDRRQGGGNPGPSLKKIALRMWELQELSGFSKDAIAKGDKRKYAKRIGDFSDDDIAKEFRRRGLYSLAKAPDSAIAKAARERGIIGDNYLKLKATPDLIAELKRRNVSLAANANEEDLVSVCQSRGINAKTFDISDDAIREQALKRGLFSGEREGAPFLDVTEKAHNFVRFAMKYMEALIGQAAGMDSRDAARLFMNVAWFYLDITNNGAAHYGDELNFEDGVMGEPFKLDVDWDIAHALTNPDLCLDKAKEPESGYGASSYIVEMADASEAGAMRLLRLAKSGFYAHLQDHASKKIRKLNEDALDDMPTRYYVTLLAYHIAHYERFSDVLEDQISELKRLAKIYRKTTGLGGGDEGE